MLSYEDKEELTDIIDCAIPVFSNGVLDVNIDRILSELQGCGYDIVKRSDDNAEG